jgi:hypothetical protein
MMVRVREEHKKVLEQWKARVEKFYGIPLTWDQLLALYANSKVMP